MSLLKSITTGKQHNPRRCLLYGTHGIGKSTFAAMAEKPIFIKTEDGLGEIDCASFPLAKSLNDVMQAIESLYTETHDFKTVAVDSLDWLEQLIWEKVCKEHDVESIGDVGGGFGRGEQKAAKILQTFLEGMDALRAKGMGVVLIAHSQIKTHKDPETESYDRHLPRLHKTASSLVQEWCDEVFFATYKVFVKEVEKSYGQSRKQGFGTGDRVIRTTERPSHQAKNRLNMPDEIELNWNEYAKFFTTTKEKKSNG